MYCKWCGHHYQNQYRNYASMCKPCISRRKNYANALYDYKKKPTQARLARIIKYQEEYKQLALQGYKVPEDVENLMKGGTVE